MKEISVMKTIIDAEYQRYRKRFQKITEKNKIALLGDSMIAYMPLKVFGIQDIVLNLGIPGDTTIGVLKRLEDLYPLSPSRVILNIGSNDIVLTDLPPSKTVDHILEIKDTLESKGIHVTVVSMTPVLRNHPLSNMDYIQHRTNADLIKINQKLIEMLPHDSYIDVFTDLLNESGALDVSYTTDGIHLNSKGYSIYLSKLNLI
jgi:lysophospholipase L1-like esterase